MSWSHRPTWKDSGDNDRTVLNGGMIAGRILYVSQGPQTGQWRWSGSWIGPGHCGIVESFDQALEAVRNGYREIEATDPQRLQGSEI